MRNIHTLARANNSKPAHSTQEASVYNLSHAKMSDINMCACSCESGDFFALDMGGTNFRTVYVKLSDKHSEMVRQNWHATFAMFGVVKLAMHCSFATSASCQLQGLPLRATVSLSAAASISNAVMSCFVQDDLQMDEFPLGDDMKSTPGPELFDFMAEKLVSFAARLGKK